jgi:hypothetical protein
MTMPSDHCVKRDARPLLLDPDPHLAKALDRLAGAEVLQLE